MGNGSDYTPSRRSGVAAAFFTDEGGFAVRMINNTGVPSVKGTIVSTSGSADSFVLQSNEFDAIGAVYEDGIADGQYCYVVLGGIAEVLLEDGTGSTVGGWMRSATTDGRAINAAPPEGIGAVVTSTHFKEIGHSIQVATAGVNVLCKIVLHFN